MSLKIGFRITYFRSILVFNIKLFNIFMPIIFSILIVAVDYTFYFISLGQDENAIITLLSFIGGTGILLIIFYLIMLFKTRSFFISIFHKKFLSSLLLFMTIVISASIYSISLNKIPNYIGLKNLTHSYELCDELTSFILYKNKIKAREDYTFYKYRNEMHKCQDMWELTEIELLKSLKNEEVK